MTDTKAPDVDQAPTTKTKATKRDPKTCAERGHHQWKWIKDLDGKPTAGHANQRCVDCGAERRAPTLA